MEMLVRPLQPSNTLAPMVVTELGMVTDVKPIQFKNVELPMDEIVLGITKSLISSPFKNKCLA